MSMDDDLPLRAAAIEDKGDGVAAALLAQATAQMLQAGRRVRGLLMIREDDPAIPDLPVCARAMLLVDVHTQAQYPISQDLGRDATSCRADPQGFARASAVFRQALDEAPDLIVSNRFGGLEATGGGFRAELLEVLSAEVPLLTVVATRHLDQWQSFTGGATVLPAQAQAIDQWLLSQLAAA